MKKKTVLIVDDNKTSRDILKKILESEYDVIEADNGENAICFLNTNVEISVIVLDIVMPVMNGYEFLQICSITKAYQNIPIIVVTADRDTACESKCLELGAWDFVAKPYDPIILRNRIKNAVKKCYSVSIETDQLTDIYSKYKFFRETQKMLYDNTDKKFAFIRFDIDRFSMINSFYGDSECERLLIFIANELKKISANKKYFTYGRIEHDIFCFCMPYEQKEIKDLVNKIVKKLAQCNSEYLIEPSFGIYIVDQFDSDMEEVYERACIAALKCKGKFGEYMALYDAEYTNELIDEQYLAKEMDYALECGQFTVYFQPKFNTKTNMPEGAEALARWMHPNRGIILPSKFVPIFEKNGFVLRLDSFVWENVCQYIRKWINEGKDPDPISVNISKVELYNPQLADLFEKIVKKYEISPKYLNLEVSESAYVENPQVIGVTIRALQSKGFTIIMDDFGSGYLSLNSLKDSVANELKINISNISMDLLKGKVEKVLASDMRLAKCLNIPVTVKGVEKKEQALFYKGIGCDYMQGFYFAKPMPAEDYEHLINKSKKVVDSDDLESTYKNSLDNIMSENNEVEKIFENSIKPIAIYEYTDGNLVVLKANNIFLNIIECDSSIYNNPSFLEKYIEPKEIYKIKAAFEKAVKTKDIAHCEHMKLNKSGKIIWLSSIIYYMATIGKKNYLFGLLNDISLQRNIEIELDKYRQIAEGRTNKNGMLILADMDTNRSMLNDFFEEDYNIYEAENCQQAIMKLRENRSDISVIILDICLRPIEESEFLKIKNSDIKIADIPTVVVSSSSKDSNVNMLELGINEFITAPLEPEHIKERIKVAIDYNSRFRQMLKEHEKALNKKALIYKSREL